MSTGGPWSLAEKSWHINFLELLVVTPALKTFAKNKTSVGTNEDRQYHSSSLYKQSRRYNVKEASITDQ